MSYSVAVVASLIVGWAVVFGLVVSASMACSVYCDGILVY